MCIPKPSLVKLKILSPLHTILNKSVECKSLCRIYAHFDKNNIWFKQLKKTVTNNQLRYIIPIDYKGIIMISYTDHLYTKFWKNIMSDQDKLKKQIVRLIKKTFILDGKYPTRYGFSLGLWCCILEKMLILYLFQIICLIQWIIYICGENYSLYQSWVEGSLDSCNKCLGYFDFILIFILF